MANRDRPASQALYAPNQYVFHAGKKYFADGAEGFGYFQGRSPVLVAIGADQCFGDDSLLKRFKTDGCVITPLAMRMSLPFRARVANGGKTLLTG